MPLFLIVINSLHTLNYTYTQFKKTKTFDLFCEFTAKHTRGKTGEGALTFGSFSPEFCGKDPI